MLYLLLNLLPSTLTRVYGFKLGYQGGREFLAKIQADGTLEKVTEAAKILGLVVIGGLVPTIVAVPVSLQLNMGGGSFTSGGCSQQHHAEFTAVGLICRCLSLHPERSQRQQAVIPFVGLRHFINGGRFLPDGISWQR